MRVITGGGCAATARHGDGDASTADYTDAVGSVVGAVGHDVSHAVVGHDVGGGGMAVVVVVVLGGCR